MSCSPTARIVCAPRIGEQALAYAAGVADDSHEPLLELANPLMSTIVLPYLGAAAAQGACASRARAFQAE
jgi:hypothetical protein